MSDTVQACPFCGSWEAAPKTTEILGPKGRLVFLSYHCPTCHAQGPRCRSMEEAREQWNDQYPRIRQQRLL